MPHPLAAASESTAVGDRLQPVTLLDDARVELAQKTRSQIEEETAYKWAARAVAAYENLVKSGDDAHAALRWLRDFEHYRDESTEHAALADDTGSVLQAVRAWMLPHVPKT